MRWARLGLIVYCGCGPSVGDKEDWPDWESQRVGFWSPEWEGGLHLVDVATGHEEILALPRASSYGEWTFAVGGDQVVVDTRGMWYESFDVATGERIGLVAGDDCGPLGGLVADPWGESIALARADICGFASPMTLEVHTYDDGWTAREVFTSVGEILEFAWAPEARSIAVVHTPQPERWVLTRVDVDTDAAQDLFVGDSPLSLPRLSPDATSWAVAEGDLVHMPTWHEQLDDDVQSLAWHPTNDELVALTTGVTSWILHPAAESSSFGTYHTAQTIMIGWPNAGGEHPFLAGCGDGGLALWVDADGRECMPNVVSAAWSSAQALLLVEADDVLIVEPGADTLRALGPGVTPRWAP